MGQDDVGPHLAQQPRQAPHRFHRDQKHGVVGAEEVDVPDSEDRAPGAYLVGLDVRALLHQFQQFGFLRNLLAMKHGVADHRVVHPGPVGQHHAADIVSSTGMMRHGSAGLVEDVRRVRSDGEQAQGFTHGIFSSTGHCERDPKICLSRRVSPRPCRQQQDADAEVYGGEFVGRSSHRDEGVAAHEGVHAHRDDHGAAEAQGREGGQQTQDPGDAASELGKGGQGLEDAGGEAVRAHPAEGILDLRPAVNGKGEAGDHPQQQQRPVRDAGVLGHGEKSLEIHGRFLSRVCLIE